jgi:hypothetical protein
MSSRLQKSVGRGARADCPPTRTVRVRCVGRGRHARALREERRS